MADKQPQGLVIGEIIPGPVKEDGDPVQLCRVNPVKVQVQNFQGWYS